MTDETLVDTTPRHSREPFDQLGFEPVSGDAIIGTDGDDTLRGDAPASPGDGLPGALGFWSFSGGLLGGFADARGGPAASAYRLIDAQAVPQGAPTLRAGPDGSPGGALEFNGDDSFGFIDHSAAMEVTQGTVSLWVQPDDLSDDAIILSKDQSGPGTGGHFRLGHDDEGHLFLRFADGNGGKNYAWTSAEAHFTEGEWTHVAVSFTDDGITVYADGVAIPDYAWARKEGNLDSPAQADQAYLLQNAEPWVLGADTSHSKANDTPAEFAADHADLHDAFDGAIADFGLWGGFTPDDALDAGEVWQLFTEGPGEALTAPSGPQPMLAGNDVIDGGAGNDALAGDGGDDELLGGDGHDSLEGGYGNDILDGGAGNDVLEGGRGSDLLLGGAGDDLLVSRSDSGEQRIGQLAIGEPTRGDPDNEVNPDRQKLYGWEDQPLVGDDIMVGGEGRDTFLFNPQINAKRDIIMEHAQEDRTINWAGVAGENNELHDHWVDSFGIDVIADYRAGEDTIAIIGHTVTPEVEHKLIDTDGDGEVDEAISVITVYSNQGGGGGAHTEDLIGQIVVHGDLVDADDIVREAGVTHGIVQTLDELQEALAPTGELKTSVDGDGNTVIGYDTRDAEGNLGLVTSNPQDFVDNPFATSDRFAYAGNVPDDVPAPVAVIDEASHPELDAMVLTGEEGVFVNVAHEGRAADLAQASGTIAFTFVANSPGAGYQALFSKDASGYEGGGHVTAWLNDHGQVKVRYQSTDKSVYLGAWNQEVAAGVPVHFAFSFDGDSAELYLDGELKDSEDLSEYPSYAAGMTGNAESLVFGASAIYRPGGTLDKLRDFFDGTIDDVVVADRALLPVEIYKLVAADGDFSAIGLDSTHPLNTAPDADLPVDPAPGDDAGLTPAGPAPAPGPGPGPGDDVGLGGSPLPPAGPGTEGADVITGADGNDVIEALGGDDSVDGIGGLDTILGGYGDDRLEGGAGNDVLDGGRGSDLLLGGDGDDLLIARSDAGEQRIGQLAIGEPTRGDPDGEVNPDRQKLYGWEAQPLVADDILVGGEGRDTFLIAPQINAKQEIIEKHTRDDGTIKWSAIAGENNELHDHWVDSFGIDVIADYDASEDHIAIIGHTVAPEVEYRDVDGDGDLESIITVYSNQGGGGGAHTRDLIGQVIVHGDKVDLEDVKVEAGVTYGIVDTIDELDEAINPTGESKVSTGPVGETILGYDTRDANGNLGPIVSNPEDYVDNPYLAEVAFADPSEAGQQNSRAPFEPLGFEAASDDVITGTDGDDTLRGDAPAPSGDGLPGAIGFWSFSGGLLGAFSDARGGPEAVAYRLFENQALVETDTPVRAGPDGSPGGALAFNGKDAFGFIEHSAAMEVTQGTVSLWVQPDDVSDCAIILSKDECGAGDGGHFRLGHDHEGHLFLRFADGNGGKNYAWTSAEAHFTEGEWTHVAVSFTEDGITVYADGVAIPDYAWARDEGNLDSPAQADQAYLLQNAEPWVLGADTSGTHFNDTAAEFATDDDRLDDAFDGAIADFGLWGGFTPDDALDAGEVWQLFTEGPGEALTAPSGPQPMLAGNDVIDGGAGNDALAGDGGDDELLGGDGHDSLEGGYGNDILDGGAGNDVLEGGRGSDLLLGGAGDDLLVSRSDSGEQRIGQLAIGEPTRGDPDNEVNPDRQKLYGWEDQPLVGDDIMVGGEGRDTFLFNPQINAKRDIIMEHAQEDRTINWAGVAGENNELHDHWVDSFGIDVIADYRAGEDTIAIIGHTVTPEVEHKLIDTDGDGEVDEAISVITVYSNQGGGGGAHTEDLIGQIVVHGDLVDADDIVREAGVTHGIVQTLDELQEALAPTGELKTSVDGDGNTVIGYDTRDAEGNLGLVTSNPQDFVDNPFATSDRFAYAGNVPDDVPAPVAVIDEASHPELDAMVLTGEEGVFVNVAHEGRAADLAQASGTIAFTFVANSPGAGYQALFSKDASGYEGGGHVTAWLNDHGQVKVRYQSTDKSVYLGAWNQEVAAGVPVHFAFSFDGDSAELYLDGELKDSEDLSEYPSYAAGMTGNAESLVFGASAIYRPGGTLDKLRDFFDGTIDDVVVLDRVLYGAEAFKLANGALEIVGTADDPAVDPADPPGDDVGLGGPGDEPVDPPVDGGGDTPADPPGDDVGLGGPGDEPADPPVDGGGDDPADPPGDDVGLGGPGDEPADPPIDGGGDDPADPPGDDVGLGGPGDEPADPPVDGSGDEPADPPGDDVGLGGPGDEPVDPPVDGGGDDAADPPGDDVGLGGPGDEPADPPVDGGGDDAADPPGDDVGLGGPGDEPADPSVDGVGDGPAEPPVEHLVVNGTAGDDDLAGGDGDDVLSGGSGNDVIEAGDGADTARGGRGDDVIAGGPGDDELHGGRDDDDLDGGDGDDALVGGSGGDVLAGGAGDDILSAGSGDDVVVAGDGNDRAHGGSGDDVIAGGLGNDVLAGGRGNDALDGGDGDDILKGGVGDDAIIGGAGNDLVNAGSGDDSVDAGDGDDVVGGGHGDDLIAGGLGNDSLAGGSGDDTVDGGEGDDSLAGGRGDDTLEAGAGDDFVAGGQGDDTVAGGDGDDVINGGFGDDVLDGGAGDDEVRGGRGDDVITGGTGDDEMFGGRGLDTFVFGTPAAGETLGFDTIRDFRTGEDVLQVANDLMIAFEFESDLTRMTLSDEGGAVVGVTEIYGTAVDPLLDVDRPGDDSPAPSDVLFF